MASIPTNKEFTSFKEFINACMAANCKPTTRQASKFRKGKGIAMAVVIHKTAKPLQPGHPGYCS